MPALVRTDDVRRQNTRLIMRTLRQQQRASRTELAKLTGLSPATISTITSCLIADGILLNIDEAPPQVTDDSTSRRGRPRVTLSLNPRLGCIVVIVLSMNTLLASLRDYSGKVLARAHEHFSSRSASREDFEHYLLRIVTRLIGQQPGQSLPLRHISMGVQGVVDAQGQTMLWSPVTVHKDLALGRMLHQAFDVPVWVANDGNMAVEALHWQEPELCQQNFAAILLTQGIGMGLMLNGRRFIGGHSSAGEFGHMAYMPQGALCRCGQRGCVEAYAGDYAIWRRAAGLPGDSSPLDEVDGGIMGELLSRAERQDGPERQALREAGAALGFGLRSLFALIDPVSVAFIGQGTRAFYLMEPEIRAALKYNGHMLESSEVQFHQYPDADALIQLGCATTALQALDQSALVTG